ncbi:MAG TPA: NAD-dependent epimerase, partial [Clostridiales bacterium]|nr:NAD-dependent epimerase [Clostridiales bacterium]
IDYEMGGVFLPQNKEYVNTTELVQLIAKVNGKELKLTSAFNSLVNLGIKMSDNFSKVFGSFVYDKKMAGGPGKEFDYETCSFHESIELTEK